MLFPPIALAASPVSRGQGLPMIGTSPRWGCTLGEVFAGNVLADRLPAWATSIDCRHAAQFELHADCGARHVIRRCDCGNRIPIPAVGRPPERCMECRNRERCRERYREAIKPTKFSRNKSPWENN
jgi:hypothetical protein